MTQLSAPTARHDAELLVSLSHDEVTGKVEGDEIEFSFERENNKVVYKVKISKKTMKGEADYAGQATGTWTGKRNVEEK